MLNHRFISYEKEQQIVSTCSMEHPVKQGNKEDKSMKRRRFGRAGTGATPQIQYPPQPQEQHRIDWKTALAVGGVLALALKLRTRSQDGPAPRAAVARQIPLIAEPPNPKAPALPWKLLAALEAPFALAKLADLLRSDFESVVADFMPLPASQQPTQANTYPRILLTGPEGVNKPQDVRQLSVRDVGLVKDHSDGVANLSLSTLELGQIPSGSIWTPPSDAQLLQVMHHPCVVLIIGKRGAGKSALGYRLLELLRNHGEPYAVGLPAKAQKLLPDWVGTAESLEQVPLNSVALVDESYIKFHARSSMGLEGRSIGRPISLSRQKEQSLIFIVQETRQLDVNIVSQVDVLAIKEMSELSRDFERPQLRKILDKARAAFQPLSGDRRPWSWIWSESGDYAGLIRNQLPSFWTTRLSHAFAQLPGDNDNVSLRRGHRPSRDDLKRESHKMRKANLSYDQIASNLGVSKATVWRWINEG